MSDTKIPKRWQEWWDLCKDGSTDNMSIRKNSLKKLIEELGIAEQRVAELEKELARYKEEPCPQNHDGYWFDAKGFCTYCNKYDEENNLRLEARSR